MFGLLRNGQDPRDTPYLLRRAKGVNMTRDQPGAARRRTT
jgi:hypothetical protein